MWDVSDCAYYYGIFRGMGGVNVPMATVVKGHGGMGKRACMCVCVGGGLLWSVCCKVTMQSGGRGESVCVCICVCRGLLWDVCPLISLCVCTGC